MFTLFRPEKLYDIFESLSISEIITSNKNFLEPQSVMVFEVLKRGLNNDIHNIAKQWLEKDITLEHLIEIYQKISGSAPSEEAKEQLKIIFNKIDTDNNSTIRLQQLINYLNKEYGTIQFNNGKGNSYAFVIPKLLLLI